MSEIARNDYIQNIVSAARKAQKLAVIFPSTLTESLMDELYDGLSMMVGEYFTWDQDFLSDSKVVKLLQSSLNDEEVAKRIQMIATA